jgi:hypothetical protein
MTTEIDLQSLVEELAPAIARDPRPRATIRVGAIGHRNIDGASREKIVGTVKEILSLIRQSAQRALKQTYVREQFADGLDLVVVSPLAEGADRLIARAGLEQKYLLGAILPFNLTDYESTFDLGDRVKAIADFRALLDAAAAPEGYGALVLDGDATAGPPRDAAFLNCAGAVTRWSDILIAILSEDRMDSQTGRSVQEAIAMGVPVVLIDPQRPADFTLRLQGDSTSSPEPARRLDEFIVSMLAPTTKPAPNGRKSPRRRSSFGLAVYRSERVYCDAGRACDFEYSGPYRAKAAAPAWARCCSGLNRWIEKRIERLLTDPVPKRNSGPFFWELPFDRATAAPIVELYLRYHRADIVANAYAELQRSVQIVVALLSVATVSFAAIATQAAGLWSVVFAGLELASLVLALSLVWLSHRQAWHDRWLDCRLLAEIFRYSKFLLLTGHSSPFSDLRGSLAAREGKRTWTRDHAEDVLRAHRLSVPGRGPQADAGAARLIAEYIAAQCIDDQARYHRKTGNLRLKYGKALMTVGVTVSVVTVVLVAAVFALELLLANHLVPAAPAFEPWRRTGEVLVIVLPALTAGLLAMRAFGEHDLVGMRSLSMMEALEREKRRLEGAAGMAALGDAMLRIARMLLHDVDGWRELFSGKHLET